MAKRKLDELIESRMEPLCFDPQLKRECITHLWQYKLCSRSFVGALTIEELGHMYDDLHGRNIRGKFVYFSIEKCATAYAWVDEMNSIDRAEAFIYHDALKAVLTEVCEMTLLCLWKRIGLDKHVVLGICRELWENKKYWMP